LIYGREEPMPPTREQRDEHALCGARKKNGEPCRKFAGEGTDHLGVGRCKYHGGATSSHRKHAVELEARARMVKFGTPLTDAQPHQVLLGMLRASAGHVGWLHQEIAALDDLGTHEAEVLLRVYGEERDRATRIAESCSKAGVEQAEIRFAQMQARSIVSAIRSAAGEVGLRPTQLNALGTAMRKHLAAASGDDEAAEREDEMQHRLFYRRHFKPAVRLSLPPAKAGLRFHDLRHTCASLLIAAGAHPKVIQERLGHSTITMTLDRYGHLLPGLGDALAEALDAAFDSADEHSSPDEGRSLRAVAPGGKEERFA
jgi:hypothetical protein